MLFIWLSLLLVFFSLNAKHPLPDSAHFQLPMEGILHQVLRPGSWPESSEKSWVPYEKKSTFWTQNHGGLEDDFWSPLSDLFGSMRIFKNVTVMKVGLCMVWLGMKEGWGGVTCPCHWRFGMLWASKVQDNWMIIWHIKDGPLMVSRSKLAANAWTKHMCLHSCVSCRLMKVSEAFKFLPTEATKNLDQTNQHAVALNDQLFI